MNKKLWDKGISTDAKIEKYTIGKDRDLDLELTKYDILGSVAHIRMLHPIDLLTTQETQQLIHTLEELYHNSGEIIIEAGVEDIHSQIEMLLTEKLGEMGKKIHSGRSRNDQVLLDLKLYVREEIQQITQACETLFQSFQTQSEKYKDVLMPGYTHTQIAMPSSFGLWFGAYAESLVDDLELLAAAYAIVNQNPLGSGAGYGGSFPLNRTLTTQLLGFDDLKYNVIYAQMGRGKMEKSVSYALASIAGTLSKFSADVCLYNSQNFGFIALPDQFTTGSSIMPHKKNPDVFELLRANANKIMTLPTELTLLTNNLTSGYHRDFQLLKESFIPVFEKIKESLSLCAYMVNHIEVNPHILEDEKYKYLFSVEVVNAQVLNGMPFREAYKNISKSIVEGTFSPKKEVHHTHEGSIGNLCTAQIAKKMAHVKAKFNFVDLEKLKEKLFEAPIN